MRASVLATAAFFVGSACETVEPAPLSYARCTGEAACGIGTRCEPVTLSTTGTVASLCTASCVRDQECPGVFARCVAQGDGGAARCFQGCETQVDCRSGTACRPLRRKAIDDAGAATGVWVCVPDLGPRSCVRDEDCAPFALRCELADGGAAVAERRCR